MRSMLILAFYLGDQLSAELLPFSSGLFAVVLTIVCISRVVVFRSALTGILLFSTAAYYSGLAGAFLSGTPVSAFFVSTLAMLAAMWIVGAGLRGSDSVLIAPQSAFFGVLVSSGFLLLSLLGWDAMSAMQGAPTNRGAGIYLEPSHYALYVMPLWLMAFQRTQYRLWLYVALAFAILTCFSTTLLAFLMCAFAVKVYLVTTSMNFRFHKVSGWLIIGVLVGVPASYYISSLIHVGGESMQAYVGSRLYGLMNPGDAESYNLTSLVALQGAELAKLSFSQSIGLGVGLGNFGTSPEIIEASDYRMVIREITNGLDLNLREGGLLANKLVGELGMLALLIPPLIARYFRRLKHEIDSRILNYHSAVAVVLICLIFFRGLSYFSAPACLAVFSMASLVGSRVRLVTRRRVGRDTRQNRLVRSFCLRKYYKARPVSTRFIAKEP